MGTSPLRKAMRRIVNRRMLPLLVGLLLVAVLVKVSHPAEILQNVRRAAPAAVFAALLMNVPIILLRSARAAIVLRQVGYRVPLGVIVPVQLVGQTSSSVTPASSGDYARAFMWRQSAGVPVRAGAAVVMFERLSSFVLMVVVAIGLVVTLKYGGATWLLLTGGVVATTFAPFVIERAFPRVERWALTRLTRGRLSRYTEGALGMADHFRAIIGSPALLAAASAITLVIFVLTGLQVWCLLAGLGVNVGMAQSIAVFTTSQVGGTLSTVPFGIGSMDALMIAVLAGYGVTLSISASVVVLMRGTSTLPQAVAGLIAYGLLLKSAPETAADEVTVA